MSKFQGFTFQGSKKSDPGGAGLQACGAPFTIPRKTPQPPELDLTLTLRKHMHRHCIYTTPAGLCDGTAPLHPKEHYLPAGLGEFRGDKRLFDVICTRCQSNFGQLEDVFLHNSPEAFFRAALEQRGRKRKKRKNIFYDPTAGLPPIPITGKADDQLFPILWEPTGLFECQPMKQIVFMDNKTKAYCQFPYRPGKLTASIIEAFLSQNGVADAQLAGYIFDESSKQEEREILTACDRWLRGKIGPSSVPVKSGSHVEGQMKAAITLPYLRALAKIAFHFVLVHFPFHGFESEFHGIKRFIFTGENPSEFIGYTEQSLVQELQSPNIRARQWQHVLSAQYDDRGFEARMQFYIGPYVTPHTWIVKFGKRPSRVIGKVGRGFAYRYYEDGKRDREGYVGTVIELAQGSVMDGCSAPL